MATPNFVSPLSCFVVRAPIFSLPWLLSTASLNILVLDWYIYKSVSSVMFCCVVEMGRAL